MDQNDYVDKLLSLMTSLMTRPDLAFDINKIASEVPKVTVQTVKDITELSARQKARKRF